MARRKKEETENSTKASKRVTVSAKSDRDDIVSLLKDSLNKERTDGKIAYTLLDKDDPATIVDWVSTGVTDLDIAISNRKHAGIPCGRITEITGLEASGKSLLGAHFLAEVQRKGGVAVFIDTETSVDNTFLEAIGVNLNNMLYVNVDTVEDVFDTIESIVSKVRSSNKDRLVGILVDSVAAASTKAEMETDHGKDGYATGKAIIISKAMRKITNMIARQKVALVFTNQLRIKLGISFGDPYTTSGGKALAFHASVRLRLKSLGQIKKQINGKPETVGIKTQVSVIKNRLGPPFKKSEFEIYFDRGIDNYSNWINILKSNKLIKGTKSPYTYESDILGKTIKLDKNIASFLNQNPEIKDELYNKICDSLIFKYKNAETSEIDEDVEIVEDMEGMED